MDRVRNEEVRRKAGIEIGNWRVEWIREYSAFVHMERMVEYVMARIEGVDGGSKWRAGTMENEVRLDGWCERGLREQRNDGGGCASMRETLKRVESPGISVTE